MAHLCFGKGLTSSCFEDSLILIKWMSFLVFLHCVASSLCYVRCLSCTSSCCPSVQQLSSKLSISFHHSLLFSSDTDKNNSELRLTLLSRVQIIKQRLWFHSGTFLGGCFVVCELRRNQTWRSQLVFSLYLVSAGSKAWQHQTGIGKSRPTLSFCIHIVAVHWMRGGTVSWKVNTFRRTSNVVIISATHGWQPLIEQLCVLEVHVTV